MDEKIKLNIQLKNSSKKPMDIFAITKLKTKLKNKTPNSKTQNKTPSRKETTFFNQKNRKSSHENIPYLYRNIQMNYHDMCKKSEKKNKNFSNNVKENVEKIKDKVHQVFDTNVNNSNVKDININNHSTKETFEEASKNLSESKKQKYYHRTNRQIKKSIVKDRRNSL